MTEPIQYSVFNCDICGKEVKLRQYPHGTYDDYFVFMNCSAHNPPGQMMLHDGMVRQTLYFCRDCGRHIRDNIENSKTI